LIAGLIGILLAIVVLGALTVWGSRPAAADAGATQPARTTKVPAPIEVSTPKPIKPDPTEPAGGRGTLSGGQETAPAKKRPAPGGENPGRTKGIAVGGSGGTRATAPLETAAPGEPDRLHQALTEAQAELARAQDRFHRAGAERQRAQSLLATAKARCD